MRRPKCGIPDCGAHLGRRTRGPHLFAELIIPKPGDLRAVVYRRLHDDGSRGADMAVWDGRAWRTGLRLPAKPRGVYAGPVSRARAFVKAAVR